MRPGQQNKRGRGRGNNPGGGNNGGGGNNNFNRKGGNPLSRTYDSSGPDVKIRGTAQHIAEKYGNLARDAHSSGDRVMAENYLQHAEHYNRIIAAAQAQMQDRFQGQDRGDYQDRDGNSIDQDDMDGDGGDDLGYAPQPMLDEQHHQPQQQRREQNSQGGQNNGQGREGQAQERQSEERQSQDRQPQDRQERQPRENRRDQPRRERRQDRPVQAQAADQPAVEAAVTAPAPVVATVAHPQADGSGPQPVIEGVPAEVAVEQETQGEAAAPRRRRSPAARPRRPRRGEGADEGEAGSDAGPELAEVSAGE